MIYRSIPTDVILRDLASEDLVIGIDIQSDIRST